MLLARLVMVLLLAFSTTVVVTTLGRTPAFNPQLKSDTIFGDGRTALSPAMYDQGTYEFQRGYGFLMADAIVPGDAAAFRAFATPEAALLRANTARDALKAAVRVDPGNAHAWGQLGWAQARSGDARGALEAWRISYEIAPNSAVLAGTRLDLIGLLAETDESWRQLTEADRAAIARDVAVLGRFNEGALAFRVKANPRLAELATTPASD